MVDLIRLVLTDDKAATYAVIIIFVTGYAIAGIVRAWRKDRD